MTGPRERPRPSLRIEAAARGAGNHDRRGLRMSTPALDTGRMYSKRVIA